MRNFIATLSLLIAAAATATDPYSLSYLHETNPYYPHRDFPKLTTPQWIGEPGVDAVAVLSIDDMRDHEKYEEYLRPIISRLQEIDGRAPVSIFTCFIQPDESHFQAWIDEGLNMDIHTVRHPCPLMDTSDFDAAKETYDQCVDVMNAIPRNKPVAYRMPCCDSLNTPSPRFYAEIFAKTSPEGASLSIDSSVFNIMKKNADFDFRKYIPFDSFVNTIEDYPYPYMIGSTCVEIPCTVPSDWEGHNIQGSNSETTVADIKHVIDLTAAAKGVYVFVFHPHGWIRNDQVVSIIDHTVDTHGNKIKFLQFAEIEERMRENLFNGHPIRKSNGNENGIRLLDLNADGFMDVIIANEKEQTTRLWNRASNQWDETPFPLPIVDAKGQDTGVCFGMIMDRPACIVANEDQRGAWRFSNGKWHEMPDLVESFQRNGEPLYTIRDGKDQGVRFHNTDGIFSDELIIANSEICETFFWAERSSEWRTPGNRWPADCPIVNENGEDNGVRIHDLNDDGRPEIILSNEKGFAVYGKPDKIILWEPRIPYQQRKGNYHNSDAIPPIAVDGKNFGAWFHSGHIWWRNEYTGAMPDLVDRRTFANLMGDAR